MIGVGGSRSGIGKTTYVSLLLRRLKGWGAIKYTKTEVYCSLSDDSAILSAAGKDTQRMMAAGAERVVWVQAPPAELAEVLPIAVDRLSDLEGIVVEGNSAIEFLNPDIIVLLLGDTSGGTKESAERLLRKAHIVVSESGDLDMFSSEAKRFSRSADEYDGFLGVVMELLEKKENIRASLSARSVSGKIPCQVAREIAESFQVPYREVGAVANEIGVKITACELGCF